MTSQMIGFEGLKLVCKTDDICREPKDLEKFLANPDQTKELDKIAYIRFASVYTNFKEIGEFGSYIEELDGKSKKK